MAFCIKKIHKYRKPTEKESLTDISPYTLCLSVLRAFHTGRNKIQKKEVFITVVQLKISCMVNRRVHEGIIPSICPTQV